MRATEFESAAFVLQAQRPAGRPSTCMHAREEGVTLYSYHAFEPRTRSVQNPQNQEFKNISSNSSYTRTRDIHQKCEILPNPAECGCCPKGELELSVHDSCPSHTRDHVNVPLRNDPT